MMTEEIKPEVIKKTQDSLGKFIKKPILSEKLLSKPPFRFLQDICTAAFRETGFFEGVLNENDYKPDSIKDKDGKISFLQKVISAVEAANGVKLAIKPNKVVAGHEPTHTNEFLQALAKALEKQVAQSNNATRAPQLTKAKVKTVKRQEKEGAPLKKKSSLTKQEVGKVRMEKKPSPRESDLEKGENSIVTKENAEKTERNESEMTKPRTEDEEKLIKRRDRSQVRQLPSKDSTEKISDKSKSTKSKDKIDSGNEKIARGEAEATESKRPPSAKPGNRKSTFISENVMTLNPAGPAPPKEPEPSETIARSESNKNSAVNKNEPPVKRPESNFMRMNKNSGSPSGPPNYPTKDSETTEESSPVLRPVTGMRPTTGRPASARPAAPRIRDRGEILVHEDIVKPNSGNVKIITDENEGNEAEEDENVVTVEPENELVEELLDSRTTDPLNESRNEQSLNQGEHGLLVEQILETQKELDQTRLQVVDNKAVGKNEIEWKSSRNRESTEREIKKLRLSIQTLTRSTNPLGKLLDFLEEDVDIMQKELANWKDMNLNLDQQISQERSLTEQSIEPLKAHLKELQQIIDQQLEQMTVAKGNILRNEMKIQKLLTEAK